MDEPDDSPGGRQTQTALRKAARLDRSAAALRDNLKRRKEQARARSDGDPGDALPAEKSTGHRRPT